ncbi:MAG TPA: HAD-IA family hydrolase [Stellaceae bacterium]|nr:HAD-IA family hydrolase [Stellaceae bacterium]
MATRYAAVLFDLLSGLLDSWTLWDRVAGSREAGRTWRGAYLRLTYRTGAYQPYEKLVADAAEEVGLPRSLAGRLATRYGEIKPWPEVGEVLGQLKQRVPLAVVTNCSEALGRRAIAATGIDFDVVVIAERAGFYKPDPRPYRLALEELGLPAERCLFVAGSAFDLLGTAKVGLPTFWHNRVGLSAPPGAPKPIAEHPTLHPLLETVLEPAAG